MRCPHCQCEMKEWGETEYCDRCGYIKERNAQEEVDKPQEGGE